MDMKRTAQKASKAVFVVMAALWLGGCGGAVTTTPADNGGTTAVPKAVVTLSTAGALPSGAAIGGLGITVDLPDSVTVKTTSGDSVDAGVVTTSGVAAGQATVLVLYSGATATVPAKLHIALASSSDGMPVGEFATVTCDVKPGGSPTGADFGLNDFSAVDTSGVSIPTLTAGLSEKAQ